MKNPLSSNSVANLQKESQNAMSLFEKTITKIGNIQERIQAAKAKRVAKIEGYQTKIDAKQAELDQLVEAETQNDKRVTKLLAFLDE